MVVGVGLESTEEVVGVDVGLLKEEEVVGEVEDVVVGG